LLIACRSELTACPFQRKGALSPEPARRWTFSTTSSNHGKSIVFLNTVSKVPQPVLLLRQRLSPPPTAIEDKQTATATGAAKDKRSRQVRNIVEGEKEHARRFLFQPVSRHCPSIWGKVKPDRIP